MQICTSKIYLDNLGRHWKVNGVTEMRITKGVTYHIQRLFHQDGENYARCSSDGLLLGSEGKYRLVSELVDGA